MDGFIQRATVWLLQVNIPEDAVFASPFRGVLQFWLQTM